MLGKRFLGRNKQPQTRQNDLMPKVETWYAVAQDHVAFMDADIRTRRKTEWNALPDEERLRMADEFLTRHFGEKAITIYSADEKIRVAAAWFIGSNVESSE